VPAAWKLDAVFEKNLLQGSAAGHLECAALRVEADLDQVGCSLLRHSFDSYQFMWLLGEEY
jgi:hypothetical protein